MTGKRNSARTNERHFSIRMKIYNNDDTLTLKNTKIIFFSHFKTM